MRKRNKTKKIITISLFMSLMIISVGYSVFNTNINLKAKGNIKEVPEIGGIKVFTVKSDDGLYIDETEENRYIYRGKEPNNYLKFSNKLWRIISKESDGTLKIIKDSPLDSDMQFDSWTNRNDDQNTFCNRMVYNQQTQQTIYSGCNVWAKQEGTYTNGVYSGTVTKDATLNTYLNETYLETLSDKKYIVNHIFYTGATSNNENTKEMSDAEKAENWYGSVGLLNSSDFLKASTNSACTTKNSSRVNSAPCGYENGNYLDKSLVEYWVMDKTIAGDLEKYREGYSVTQRNTAGQCSLGWLSGYYAISYYSVKPVVFLTKNIKFKNDGSKETPFEID